MTTEDRLQNLEAAMAQVAGHYWRFQGRINALELIACAEVLNFAKTQPDPFAWVQSYLEAMRQTASTLIPDVDNQSHGARLTSETRHALDDFLADLLRQSGQLPGAPDRK